ncbi:Xanthine/uracil/vitamin C permease [Leucosporidium creatinivorum]|uniref:Xanthine/uracil/vitamin C permease n=1 Tax=Leucosporidium creatinivorum TaxID=106004 RepID=A0A1Y2EPB6_9BASI|nr:Xanthine/uracil/vitamin C permease [Leucosporidium creatinivorum]
MVGGLITPPILLGGSSGAALSASEQQYLVSASIIFCGIGTCLQVSRFKLPFGYTIGSGVLTVTGTSFAFVSVGLTFINGQYSADGSGMCKLDAAGDKLPCPEAFGAFLGTATVVAVMAIALSFLPPRTIKKMFPPLISGMVLTLIGATLILSGINNWAGGAGSCMSDKTMLCPSNSAPHGEFWGSAPLIGLGFSVFISIIIFDLLGPPIVQNCSVFLGLLVGLIIAAGCGYFDGSTITSAPAATFLWTTRFPLSVRGDLVLPFIAAYLVIVSETVGNISATAEASALPIDGPDFSSRVQGGLLADTAFACIAGLATVPPLTTFSQNIGVVALTRNASRQSGYVCAFFLLIMGIFAKFGAVFVAMPASVLGGMTTFLFGSVAVAGIRILAMVKWTRRTRFIATASLSLGFASVVQPDWFSNFFTYSGDNAALSGFLNALVLIVEEGYLLALIIGIPLNLVIPYGADDLATTPEEQESIGLPTVTSAEQSARTNEDVKVV